MISVRPTSRSAECPAWRKPFNIEIFSDSIDVINVKMYVTVLLM